VRLEQTYKYCPHCAYRLRPELGGHEPRRVAPARSGVGARLIALGGYLAFASLLLLVVLAGFRLFAKPDVVPVTSSEFRRARDANALPLNRQSFRRVAGGVGYWGAWSWNEDTSEIRTFRVDDPFEIGIHEVTNDQYYLFLLDRARRSGATAPRRLIPTGWSQPSGNDWVPVMYESQTGNQPVLGVTFEAALEFCSWFWETQLGSPPDLLVDLPTPLEYVWAARGEIYDYNFPWGAELSEQKPEEDAATEERVNLDGRPLDVNDPAIGDYDGIFGLVGNAAEWVHPFPDDPGQRLRLGLDGSVPTAAGWSFENSEYRSFREPITPFSERGFQEPDGPTRRDLGFRVVLRHTPSMPEFFAVGPGPVAFGEPPRALLPPGWVENTGFESIEKFWRATAIRFNREARVGSPFEIGRTEVSNRQYLLFLIETAERTSGAALDALYPGYDVKDVEYRGSWSRERHAESVVYVGPYGHPGKIARLFPPGRENHPVEGVTAEQAEAYARWLSGRLRREARLPTVEEYLRAGRGDKTWPYPWGTDRDSVLLVCSGRADDEGRAVSLLGRFGSKYPLYGLAGNLPELVWDAPKRRHLLAGGCYMFPPSCCTLDSYMDLSWDYVEYVVRSYDDDTGPLALDGPKFRVDPRLFAGFRLVLERGRP
jgi:formylglycine-generating enzyme required for sulfatase activity